MRIPDFAAEVHAPQASIQVEKNWVDVCGIYGASLSMIEIGLGSILHALHVPLRGYFLSLNQGFFLAHAVRQNRHENFVRRIPLGVSLITALLKSLSPAGNRLGPMIAIAMQGWLMNLGVLFLGPNIFGVGVGVMLLCLWSYIQTFLYFYLLFGKELVEVLRYYLDEVQPIVAVQMEDVLLVLAIVIGLKLVLGLLLAMFAFVVPQNAFARYQARLVRLYQPRPDALKTLPAKKAWRAAITDLMSPLFLCTIGLMAVFFVVSNTPWQWVMVFLLRPLALGYLLFFAIRIFPTERVMAWLGKSRFTNLAGALQKAVNRLKKQ